MYQKQPYSTFSTNFQYSRFLWNFLGIVSKNSSIVDFCGIIWVQKVSNTIVKFCKKNLFKILPQCYFYFLYPKYSAKIYYTPTFTYYAQKVPQKSTILKICRKSTLWLLLLSIPKKFRKNLLYCCFYFLYPKNSAKIYYIITIGEIFIHTLNGHL